MTQSRESNCRRPLVRVLGHAAYCNVCGAERGEPCRLERYAHLGPLEVRTHHPDGTVTSEAIE